MMEKVLTELAIKIPELLLLGGLFFFITKWQLQLIDEQQKGQREQSKDLNNDYDKVETQYFAVLERLTRVETLYEELKKDNVACSNKTAFLKRKVDDILITLNLTKKRDDPKP